MLKLKELRKEKGVTQATVAKYLGVSPQAYGFYETGKRELNGYTLVKLAEYFNVSTDYILGVTEEKEHIFLDAENFIKKLAFECVNEPRNDIIEQACASAIKYLDKNDKYTILRNVFDLLSKEKYKDTFLEIIIDTTV